MLQQKGFRITKTIYLPFGLTDVHIINQYQSLSGLKLFKSKSIKFVETYEIVCIKETQ